MRFRGAIVAAVAGLMVFPLPRPASACGGTFCDGAPQAMPVDQTGENVLFVLDGDTVEAHVQIQYTGDPMRFAWVVPMPAIPEVEVGSQLLFQSLLGSTVPTFNFSTQRDVCGPQNPGGPNIGTGSGGSGNITVDAGGKGGPSVVFQATVGAFEVTVLQGGTADEVSTWLSDNEYQSIPSAPAILADYVAQNFVFVAIKLTAGVGVDEIHPLVFRYSGNEPCVPLKLTAVAAQENMGVRVFFLGDDRMYPTNYKHVEVNPVRFDWTSRGTNYNAVVTRAVDSPVADGHAFVTEYAGPSATANQGAVFFSPTWDGARFATLAPELVVDELTNQGLGFCFDEFQCQFSHPLIVPLLQEYLPVPQGLTDGQFYSCLSCYLDQIDTTVWDAAAFAAAFDTRIVEPGAHAQELLDTWPFLTRMFTTISPSEMTEDPLFHARPDMSEFVNTSFFSTQRITCCGASSMTLPDAREVALFMNGWPPFSSLMPYAERITEVPLSGPAVTLVDNSAQIDQQVMLWNEDQNWPPSNCSSSGGASSGSGGATQFGGRVGDDVYPAGNNDGCGCSLPTRRGALGGYLTLAAVAVTLIRRRQRRQ